jgi:tape measure domain-containing protein
MNFGGSGDVNISVGGDLTSLQQALNQIPVLARQAGEAAAAALSSAASSGGATSGAFADAAKATQQLSDAMNAAVGAAAQLDKELQQKPTDAGNAAQAFGELGKQLSDAGAAMVLIGGVLSGISAGLIEIGESALMAAGKMEQQRTAMENLTHSASQTDTLIKEMVTFAVNTPFEIPGVIEMGQKLVAMGTATKDVIPLLTTLGDTASGSGKGFAGLNILVNDFGKMAQLGTVHMRELNTLAYQGVPAIQALADAFGVSTNRMRQMVEQNLVASADAMPILIKAMNDKFGGMMEAQSHTLLGMWSNFKDTITKTLIAIGDAITPAAKAIITAMQPVLDMIQRLAEGFGQLPQWAQTAIVGVTVLVGAIGPLTLALGGMLYVAGQILSKLPALTALLGVELPAAFAVSGTAATGAALKMGEATAATTALSTGLSLVTKAVGIAAAAFIAWEIGKWAYDNIPGVQKLIDKLGELATKAVEASRIKEIGMIAGALLDPIDPKQIAGVNELNEALKNLGVTVERGNKNWDQYRDAVMKAGQEAGLFSTATEKSVIAMNSTALAVEGYKRATKEANDEVERTRKALEATNALYNITVNGIKGVEATTQDVARAQEAYNKALKAAHPELKGVADGARGAAKAFDEHALAAQTTGAAIEKYIKLWGTIPWEAWQGDVQQAAAAFREKGFSIDKAVASLKKMADALEGPASTSAALKAQYDEILANINVLEGLKRAIDAAASASTGWVKTMENGVEVWRQSTAAATGFTTTVENGITVIRGSKESLDGMGASAKSVTTALGETTAAAEHQTTAIEHLASTHSKAAKEMAAASSIMAGSFMQGMNGMTASGEQYIAMLAQMGALQSDIARAAFALGYQEIGTNQFVSADYRKNYQGGATQTLLDEMDKFFQDKIAADAKALEDHAKAVDDATHKYDDLLITVNGMIMTVKEYNELGKKITDAIVNPLAIGSKEASDALGGLATAATDATGAFSNATKSTENWSDFIQAHADLLPQIQGTIRDALIKVGTNFYDAADMAERLAQGLDVASDVVSQAVMKMGSVEKGFSSEQITALAEERKRVNEAEIAAYQNMRKVISDLVAPVQTMTYPTEVMAPRTGYISPSISPGASQSPGTRYVGPIGLGGVVQSNGGVNVYVTGNNIMDQATVNSLTNRIATQMTQVLRRDAGLKV